MAGYPPPAVAKLEQGTRAVKRFTLGFMTARGGTECAPTWGGYAEYEAAGATPYRIDDVRALRKAGGDVVVSFGGQAGTELAAACDSVDALKAAYAKVVDAYAAKRLDFDIEGGALSDQGLTSAGRRRSPGCRTTGRGCASA